jgi:hypothetical protein
VFKLKTILHRTGKVVYTVVIIYFLLHHVTFINSDGIKQYVVDCPCPCKDEYNSQNFTREEWLDILAPRLDKVPVTIQENEWSYICVSGE